MLPDQVIINRLPREWLNNNVVLASCRQKIYEPCLPILPVPVLAPSLRASQTSFGAIVHCRGTGWVLPNVSCHHGIGEAFSSGR